MNVDELCFLSISEAAGLVQSRQLSPVELTRAHLERIERTEPTLNAFITLLSEEAARERAEERRNGK